MNKTLFLICGVPGSGKTTWVKKQIDNAPVLCKYVSRDDIRYSLLQDGEEYFSHEDEVFNQFIDEIKDGLIDTFYSAVFADATHLTPDTRKKTLDAIGNTLTGVDINVVNFNIPFSECMKNNESRKGTKYFVPRAQMRSMFDRYIVPSKYEEYNYNKIITIGIEGGEKLE